jgi:hypothetical protein
MDRRKTTLDRIAMLLDELQRRGVPADLLQPLIKWLMEQR